MHGRTPVGLGVLQENERLGGITSSRRDIEVIAQCVSLASDHQGVLFVRVIALARRVVLKINPALCLKAWQRAGTIVAGEYDFIRRRRPFQRVTTKDSGP